MNETSNKERTVPVEGAVQAPQPASAAETAPKSAEADGIPTAEVKPEPSAVSSSEPNYRFVLGRLGIVMIVFSFFSLVPMAVSAICFERSGTAAFLITALISLTFGIALTVFGRDLSESGYSSAEVCLTGGLALLCIIVFGAFPYTLSGVMPSYLDAIFESASGFASVGISVAEPSLPLPLGMLVWRTMTGWLGGMGYMIFLVSMAHTCGSIPQHDGEGSRPRMTLRLIAALYIMLTASEIAALLLCGVGAGDAFMISLSSAGCCGFLTTSAVSGSVISSAAAVITVFMLIHGAGYSVFFLALAGKFRAIPKNGEMRFYLQTVMIASAALALIRGGGLAGAAEQLPSAILTTVSTVSSTGFSGALSDSGSAAAERTLVVILAIAGAGVMSAGSGIRIRRASVLLRTILARPVILARNLFRMTAKKKVHSPLNIFTVPSKDQSGEAWRHLGLFSALTIAAAVLLRIGGTTVSDAVTAALACTTGLGPGLGAADFSAFTDFSKAVMTAAMVLGRLEIVCFIPVVTALIRSGGTFFKAMKQGKDYASQTDVPQAKKAGTDAEK